MKIIYGVHTERPRKDEKMSFDFWHMRGGGFHHNRATRSADLAPGCGITESQSALMTSRLDDRGFRLILVGA